MPLMVFFALGLVQLAMVQQARLMTEYAGYCAARAGIVWNGSNERMHDAAVIALLPTLGKTSDRAALGSTWQYHQGLDRLMQPLPWGAARAQVNGQSLTGMIRIDTISPQGGAAAGVWNQVNGAGWEELDFDGPETFPESSDLDSHVQRFFDLQGQEPGQDAFRKATLLQIRLRYFYEMRVPFVNQVIFLAWYAANADVALSGAIDRSTTNKQNMLGKSGDARSLRGRGKGLWDPLNRGLFPLTPTEMQVLWDVSTGALPLGAERRYFLPLQATHSMRMQSNFFRKWLVH
ncbi:MAG: pilus assembly protein [Archangiaceae bacterium]|nr:pilus assembly protein [Archangiaceae bacterium]